MFKKKNRRKNKRKISPKTSANPQASTFKTIQNADMNPLTRKHVDYYDENVKPLQNQAETTDKASDVIQNSKKKGKTRRVFRKNNAN